MCLKWKFVFCQSQLISEYSLVSDHLILSGSQAPSFGIFHNFHLLLRLTPINTLFQDQVFEMYPRSVDFLLIAGPTNLHHLSPYLHPQFDTTSCPHCSQTYISSLMPLTSHIIPNVSQCSSFCSLFSSASIPNIASNSLPFSHSFYLFLCICMCGWYLCMCVSMFACVWVCMCPCACGGSSLLLGIVLSWNCFFTFFFFF